MTTPYANPNPEVEVGSDAARKGAWFQTYTGKKFWPLDPRLADIDIVDIAHALSNICRYGGHSRKFYSVAQHSVYVSQFCRDPRLGLMHDATEAYIGDMVRPLKWSMPEFRAVEDRLWAFIAWRFGLPFEMPDYLKATDNLVLMTERRDLVTTQEHRWHESLEAIIPIEPHILTIKPWHPAKAEREFLQRFEKLFPDYVPRK